MRPDGLHGFCKHRSCTVTTERNKSGRPVPDLFECAVVAGDPNRLWVIDLTYVCAREAKAAIAGDLAAVEQDACLTGVARRREGVADHPGDGAGGSRRADQGGPHHS